MAGDFYDLIPLPDNRIGILIADVADKGVGPALYMALSRTLIRTYASQYVKQPEKVFHYVNKRILQDADYGLFVTTFYGVLDPATGILTYANAGHNPPWVFEPGKPEPCLLTRTGMALGVDETVLWTKNSMKLVPGSTIFFYTDGATDAQNPQEELFGEENLLQIVRSKIELSTEELRLFVVNSLREFMDGTSQFDDITLIIIKRDI
jgi:sigma-B regulation protein RsbU (phosphoserine phosphatase)